MGLDENGYYSLRQILGYNCKYNIVLSDRGRGKTYGTKAFLMSQPGEFMCLYRTTADLDSAVESWVDSLYEQGYEPEAFEWEPTKYGAQLKYGGYVKGYFRALSMVNHVKQETFPDTLNWVWLDEFIPLVYKKLAGVSSEGDAIRAIVKTIEHDTVHPREEKGLKPVRVLMYANPFTWNNPILSYFRCEPRGYGIWKVGPGVACEVLEPMPSPQEGKMTVDDFLGDEVNRNQGWLRQDAFVEKVPKHAVPEYSIRIGLEYFTRYELEGKHWIKATKGHCNVSRPGIINSKPIMLRFGSGDGLQKDEMPIGKVMGPRLKDEAYSGLLNFDSVNTKFDYLRAMNEI